MEVPLQRNLCHRVNVESAIEMERKKSEVD
jgi:hypothetical protein